MLDLDHHALMNHRARVVREVGVHQLSDPIDFMFWNRRGLALDRDDVHDTGTLQDR